MEVYRAATGEAPAAGQEMTAGFGSAALKREDFLLLLMTQLKHQDPLEPMDNQAMMTQFAQLNSLEELQSINEKMADLADAESLTEASSLIGKSVAVETDDGTQAAGIVESVSRLGSEVLLWIEGVSYPLSALSFVEKAEA